MDVITFARYKPEYKIEKTCESRGPPSWLALILQILHGDNMTLSRP